MLNNKKKSVEIEAKVKLGGGDGKQGERQKQMMIICESTS